MVAAGSPAKTEWVLWYRDRCGYVRVASSPVREADGEERSGSVSVPANTVKAGALSIAARALQMSVTVHGTPGWSLCGSGGGKYGSSARRRAFHEEQAARALSIQDDSSGEIICDNAL
ncbi:hypothetical protein Misp03_35170 [Microbispora sp. NBRC 16548]|nr:hypothetical protein Misp03_35170 [Microbispora sp. NBRC 16548]